VEYRALYQLDPGVTITQQSIYYFRESLEEATAQRTVEGPLKDNVYTYRDMFNPANVWSPCGQKTALNLRTTHRVSNAGNLTGTGYISSDFEFTGMTERFFFQWQACAVS
jgi:hypothetical protein